VAEVVLPEETEGGSAATFQDLMTRLRDGQDDAAREIVGRFAERLIALASHRLLPYLRRKVDPEDVVQSVWGSFFKRGRAGQFQLADWDNLWALLACLTVRKCTNRIAYFHAQRRDQRAEQTLGPDPDSFLAAAEPTPEEHTVMAESLEQFLNGLDADDREIIALHLQGLETPAISEQLGRSQRTVRRIRERAEKKLRRILETAGSRE
jgi:RNA polymerase sigma-70 factor (ECF subfamily)